MDPVTQRQVNLENYMRQEGLLTDSSIAVGRTGWRKVDVPKLMKALTSDAHGKHVKPEGFEEFLDLAFRYNSLLEYVGYFARKSFTKAFPDTKLPKKAWGKSKPALVASASFPAQPKSLKQCEENLTACLEREKERKKRDK